MEPSISFHRDWNAVWQAAESLPPETSAWDGTLAFNEALVYLAQKKIELRGHERLRVALEVALRDCGPILKKHVPEASFEHWEAQAAEDVTAAIQALEDLNGAGLAVREAYAAMHDEQIPVAKLKLREVAMQARALLIRESASSLEPSTSGKDDTEGAEFEAASLMGAVVNPLTETQVSLDVSSFEFVENSEVMCDGQTVEEAPQQTQQIEDAAIFSHESSIQSGLTVDVTEFEILPAQPVDAVTTLPDSIVSFEMFNSGHWINLKGECVMPPWLVEGFDEQIEEQIEPALNQRHWAYVWLLSEAARLRIGGTLVEPQDVEAAAHLCAQVDTLVLPHADWRRVKVFEEAGKHGHLGTSLLTVALYSLRPGEVVGEVLSYAQADALQERLEESCGSDMAEVLAYLLKLPSQNASPAERLRVWGQGAGHPMGAVVAPAVRLAQARTDFREWMAKHWKAAGGRLQQTHCRRAWDIFVKKLVEPLTVVFYPQDEDQHDHLRWDLGKLRRMVDALVAEGHKVANKEEVQDADRSRFNRTMEQAHTLVLQLVKLAQEARQQGAVHEKLVFDLPAEALQRLLSASRTAAVSALILELLRRDTRPVIQELSSLGAYPLSFSAVDISRHPDLLTLFSGQCFETHTVKPAISVTKHKSGAAGDTYHVLMAKATAVNDPVRAVAMLLEPPLLDRKSQEDWVEVRDALRDHLLQGPREELLLAMQSGGAISADDATAIRTRQTSRMAELATKRAELLRLERLLLDMDLRTAADQISKARETLDQYTSPSDTATSGPETMLLLEHWTSQLIQSTTAIISQQRLWLDYRVRSQLLDAERKQALIALEAGRFADVLRLLSLPVHEQHATDNSELRVTPWREAARRSFEVQRMIAKGKDSSDPALAALCALWLHRSGKDRELRQTFYAFICQEGVAEAVGTEVAMRDLEHNAVLVRGDKIIERLTLQGRNPTFLPQLRNFTKLEIRIHPSSGVQDEAGRLVGEFSGHLAGNHWIVLLSPGLEADRRTALLRKFRSQRAAVALVDDLDLCRLIDGAAHGSLFIGLMEIVLEQVDWLNKSPFRLTDGQFIQLDMFVGRVDDAKQLAEQSNYTRVFAGRRLGKSALLRYLELNRDGKSLPSGQTLRVLYVMAANEQESRVVANILNRLLETTGFNCSADTTALPDPADKLTEAMQEFAKAHPNDNLLILLDEADFFVEDQIRQYEKLRRKEACLSFKMAKIIPGQAKDKNGEPRVRFLIAGYRLTNKREGAWLSAGEVKELNLLRDVDAQNLIAGPLARMGVNAQDLAPVIAFRCGFQPAVILRFGDRLVQKLSGERGRDMTVTADDVHAVLEDRHVEDEIRAVILNNFQDDNVNNILFTALLIAFQQSGNAGGLPDSEIADKMLVVLTKVNADLGWLTQLNADHQAHIRSCLRNFETRKLLSQIEEKLPDGRMRKLWSLRFPHFLSVMLKPADEDIETRLRKLIEATREAGPANSSITGLIPSSIMEELRGFLQPTSDTAWMADMHRGRVVCSPWHAGLVDQPNSLLDRLEGALEGIKHHDWKNATSPNSMNDVLAIHVTAEAADVWRKSAEPQLRPVFFGGMDLLRWALDHDDWECTGLGRLSLPYVTWWFERARSWHFQSINMPSHRVWLATGGIPFLIGKVDKILGKPFGGDVSATDFEEALKYFREQLPSYADELVNGASEVRLTMRELVILRMACKVTENFGPELNFARELGTDWNAVRDTLDMAHAAALYTEPSDASAILLLQRAGFLPLDDNGDINLHADDPLHSLVKHLPQS